MNQAQSGNRDCDRCRREWAREWGGVRGEGAAGRDLGGRGLGGRPPAGKSPLPTVALSHNRVEGAFAPSIPSRRLTSPIDRAGYRLPASPNVVEPRSGSGGGDRPSSLANYMPLRAFAGSQAMAGLSMRQTSTQGDGTAIMQRGLRQVEKPDDPRLC